MHLSGNPFDFVLVFLGGVLVSFTPCVYPLLPITVAYIGANNTNSRIKGFVLSLIYVTGMSITYSALGLIAVLTGAFFGQFSNQPLVRIIAGLIVAVFGIFLWSERGLKVPDIKTRIRIKRHKDKGKSTYFFCLVLGMASGLVISPCTAPALGAILTFVAIKRNFVYGAFLLFSFAFGMGLLLILAGTFSSFLTALPKSGNWLRVIKKIAALILIVVGLFIVIDGAVNLAYAQGTQQTRIIAKDFTLKGLDGDRITLSELKGKKSVLLLFWTTWCPFCVKELRHLNKLHSKIILDDIEIFAINVQESESKVKYFISRNPVTFKVLLDGGAETTYAYGVRGIPSFVLINKNGELLFQDHYFPEETYKKLLAE